MQCCHLFSTSAASGTGGAEYHAYLLLSKEGARTMVLETGEELQEVTDKCVLSLDCRIVGVRACILAVGAFTMVLKTGEAVGGRQHVRPIS